MPMPIFIYLKVGESTISSRLWSGVPRVGDRVLLRNEKRPRRVLTVLWWDRVSDNPDDREPTVEVTLGPMEDF